MNSETSVSELLLALQEKRKDKKEVDPLEDKLVALVGTNRDQMGVMMMTIRNKTLLQPSQPERRMMFQYWSPYLVNFVELCKKLQHHSPTLDVINKVITSELMNADDAQAISRLIFQVAEIICNQAEPHDSNTALEFRDKIRILSEAYAAISVFDE